MRGRHLSDEQIIAILTDATATAREKEQVLAAVYP
jgi:hypothetical protein